MHQPHAVIAGAAFDLLGFVAVDLHMLDSASHEQLLASLRRWAQQRDLNLLDADLEHWSAVLTRHL